MHYHLLANAVMLLHFAYVAYVVGGQLTILCGVVRGWRWVRGAVFRVTHLLAILLVVAESVAGVECPLTTWEVELRLAAGEEGYPPEGGFLAYWVHRLMFFEGEPWVFTLVYALFALLVVASWVVAPPRFTRRLPRGAPVGTIPPDARRQGP